MKKKRLMIKIRNFISFILIVLILTTSFTFRIFATNGTFMQNIIENKSIISENEEIEEGENSTASKTQESSTNQFEDEKTDGLQVYSLNSDIEDQAEEDESSSKESNEDEEMIEGNLLNNSKISVNQTMATSNSDEATENEGEGFKIALRWGGTTAKEYVWNAEKKEDRVIKLTFYYQNEVANKKYMPGDLKVTIPGIGKLNRDRTIKASDIAADAYGSTEQKRDWSYKYDSGTDTYTFYNNKEIEKGATFNGSFEMLWKFTSRECINDYTQNLQATLNDEEEIVLSPELSLNFTSKRDTFYIEKTAKSITSADGLKRFVEDGREVSDYAWVQYTFRYNVQELNARGLQNRYFIDTLPQGCVIAKDTNVIKNENGTVSYKIEESTVLENSVREYSVIVGYPEEYVGKTVKNVVNLYGRYKDEKEEVLLATSEIEVQLQKIQDRVVGIVPGKYMSPDYIYKEAVNGNINFSASLYATANTTAESEYSIAITDDLLEIYTDTYHRLQDNEYKFTSVTVPSKNSFYNANGYILSEGDYTVKIYALYTKDVNTRSLDEYTKIYEGKWENNSITQKIEEDAVAIRVEVSGLTESIRSFYVSTSGVINVSESGYENPSYIINYDFTEFLDKDGNSLMSDINEDNYSQARLYEQDKQIYGKGVLRSSDVIRIIEKQENPGYYYANAKIDDFEVDKEIENFITKQTHSVEVRNTGKKEIRKVEIHGVNAKEELETLIETLRFTYSGLDFKYILSSDVDMNDYLRERASIEKDENEITVTFNFEDNPIIATNFNLGYTVESHLSYEEYYDSTNPSYAVTTYALLENSGLTPQSTSNHNGKTMAYGSDSANILLALASHQQLIKAVKTEYTSGKFLEEDAVLPLNTEYTYRLKLRNGYNTLINTEIIDILEHAEITEVDGEYPYKVSEWHGKLKSVDTKYIESKDLKAKVYYTNTLKPDENSWTLMENYSDGIWQTENEVLAIKVEIEGEILENSIIHVDVNMLAPNNESLEDKYAYNTYTINVDAIDLYTGLKSTYLKNMPSNVTEVRLVKKEYNVEISKVDEITKNKLTGVQFGIYDEKGNKIRTNLTGILGDTTVKGLKEGTYTIKEEIVPLGYEKQEDFILIIENGNYTLKQCEEVKAEGEANLDGSIPKISITIENKRAKGSITVYKIDEYLNEEKQEVPMQGVEFELQDTDGNIIATGTTDENGNIVFENLEWGKTYVIKETEAPQGYELAIKNTYLSKLNKDKIVTVENIRKTGTVVLTKEDEIDGTKLEEAKYGLYAENSIYNKNGEIAYEKDTLILEGTTNEEGKITFEGLPWGDYYIKETETIYGYELSEEKHLFTINGENVENIVQKTEKEKRSKANLELVKIDESGNFLSGAEFGLFDEDGNIVQEGILTDINGRLNIEGIEWGNYYIQETKAPRGYEENNIRYNFTVNRETFLNGNKVVTSVIDEESKEEISIIKNYKKKGKVSLIKYACDAEGEETTNVLQGAIFELYSSDGTKIGEYTSDENGKISIEDLDWDSYYFQEVEAPEGYSISNKKISFVVNSKNADFEQELKAYNKQESGEIKINKTIKISTIEEGHGNASFMFKVVGKDENDEEKVTLYRTVTFSRKDKENTDENGNITKSIVISDIEPYKYEITEEENYRYELSSIIPVTNAKVNEKTGIINLQVTENKGEITFTNEKVNNSLLTDSKLVTNSTQSQYYLIGIGARPKQESYDIGTQLTGSDFTFTLYYSGGQEVETDLIEGITFNGESTYMEDLEGGHITSVEYTVNGKTFETEVTTKWVRPSDYFVYSVISSSEKTIRITGINTKYTSPSVLYITSTYNGYKVKTIGWGGYHNTLSNITNVKKVVLEEGITSIGNYAFYHCSSLTSIEIPKGVTRIGNNAFNWCGNLTSIEIPEGITKIEDETFFWCQKLTNIKIPDSVTSIGSYAFDLCGFRDIEIPTSVASIGDGAFKECSKLTSIKIPEKVTSIGNSVFSECYMLTSIEIPEGVTDIGNSAFFNCSRLTNIEIPKGVTSIGNYTFCQCSNLTNIEIPEGVTSIGNHAFSSCYGFKNIKIPNNVKSIGSYAFLQCNNLTNIEIPEGVTSIGSYAFLRCNNLTNIEISEGVTSIGSGSFGACSNLMRINVSEENTEYCSVDGVLYNKDKTVLLQYPAGKRELTEYIIPDSVTSIEAYAFGGCSSLTSIEIPRGVTSIGDSTFYGCSSLTSIEIPEGVTSIGDSAFYGCSSLTSINIPEGVTRIGNYTFYQCSNLSNIEIPEGVTNIGSYAFYNCRKLTTINYHGTEEQFKAITIGSNNDYFKNATVNYIQD